MKKSPQKQRKRDKDANGPMLLPQAELHNNGRESPASIRRLCVCMCRCVFFFFFILFFPSPPAEGPRGCPHANKTMAPLSSSSSSPSLLKDQGSARLPFGSPLHSVAAIIWIWFPVSSRLVSYCGVGPCHRKGALAPPASVRSCESLISITTPFPLSLPPSSPPYPHSTPLCARSQNPRYL